MSDAQLAMAIIALLREMGGWGVDAVLMSVFLVPPMLGSALIIIGFKTIRSLERIVVDALVRSESISKEIGTRYDKNVTLVEDYQRLVRSHQAQTDSMIEIIRENTRAITLATARMEGAQGIRS